MENPAATSLVSPNIRKPFPLICSSIAADMLLQHCWRGVKAAVTGEKNMLVTQPHDGRTSHTLKRLDSNRRIRSNDQISLSAPT